MKPETQRAETFAGRPDGQAVTCPNCSAELARGTRFCRSCGYRLGEGLDEYVETVRLNNLGGIGTMPAGVGGPLASAARDTTALYSAPTGAAAGARPRRRRRLRWLGWMIFPIALVAATGGGVLVLSELTEGGRSGRVSAPPTPRSFFGGGDFESVEGEGLLLESVLRGGPADAAGLRDGDILVSFDGRPITREDELRSVLRATPIGKAVVVEYLRDGEPKLATLTTIPPDAYNPRAFMPAAGTGYWGVGGLRRVAISGTNLYGVKLGSVRSNRPADIAGLKEGDIVVEFDGQPVRTTRGLESYIDHAAPGTTVNVVVMRDGQRLEIPVKMGRED